jgi:tripartite-type tricarboxylate transporter receptor subunit TctC
MQGAAAVATSGLVTSNAVAQTQWPNRPITMICPWAAGGGTDATARIVSALIQKELGQPVNVVNRTGGSGVVGHSAIATAQPDGYTFGIITIEITMMRHQGLTELKSTDFTALGMMNEDSPAVQVGASSPYKDIRALADAIKAAPPGKIKASGTGQGGSWHVALIGWLLAMGLKPDHVAWVPSNGAAPAMQDLALGGIDVVVCSVPEARAMIDAGRVISLATMSATRNSQFPNVPTLKEGQGLDYTNAIWRGFGGPKGTSEIQTKLTATLAKIYESSEYKDFMNSRGFGMKFADGATFAKIMEETDQAMAIAMKAGGLSKT